MLRIGRASGGLLPRAAAAAFPVPGAASSTAAAVFGLRALSGAQAGTRAPLVRDGGAAGPAVRPVHRQEEQTRGFAAGGAPSGNVRGRTAVSVGIRPYIDSPNVRPALSFAVP